MKGVRKFLPLVLPLLLIGLIALPVFAGNEEGAASSKGKETVFDQADLFSDEEEAALRDRAREVGQAKKADLVILTTEDVPQDPSYGTEETEDYIKNFYLTKGFADDGMAVIIDLNNRVLWTVGHGRYNTSKFAHYTKKIYQDMLKHAADGDYYQATTAALIDLNRYQNAAYAARPTPVSILISIAVTAVSLLILLARHWATQPSRRQIPEVMTNHYEVLEHDVRYLGTSRTVRHIDRTPSSSGGGGGFHSSSGGGFSGGGGHF